MELEYGKPIDVLFREIIRIRGRLQGQEPGLEVRLQKRQTCFIAAQFHLLGGELTGQLRQERIDSILLSPV